MQAMVNFVVKRGNKNSAESIIKKALFLFVKTHKKKKIHRFIRQSIKNVTPIVNIIVFKRRHRSFQVPRPISNEKRLFFSNKWLLTSTRAGTKQNIYKNLSNELYLSAKKRSSANKKCRDLHAAAVNLRKKTERLF